MKRFASISAASVALALASHDALADGGRIAWTGERGGVTGTIIIAPAAPRIGFIQVDWVGEVPAPEDDPTPGSIVATHDFASSVVTPLEPRLATERHATLELLAAGRWTLVVDPDGVGPLEPVELAIEVGRPLPAWRSQWPWLFAWIPMTAIGWYAASRRRGQE